MADERQLEFDLLTPLQSLPQLWTPDDIYNACDDNIVRNFGEDGRVERKRATVSQRDLAEYASMWANTQPYGGIVFIGVADDGKIIGCKGTAESHINDLEAVRALCSDAVLEFKRIPIENSKGENDFVIAMRVYYREEKLVETSDGSAFMREGDRKRRLTENEKREIRLSKGELDHESERTSISFPDDFNLILLNQFRDEYLKKRNLGQRFSIEDVLSLNKLGKKRKGYFEPNIGTSLLFSSDPRTVIPGAFIRVVRYDGVEEQFGRRLNIIADKVIDGPLPLQIAEAERYIETQVRNFTRLGSDGRFATRPEFPKDVWLEAVVNAVVHRSYNLKNMNIFVKMFEDKFVVESPGSFLPPTTPETVYDAHNPRNPNIMWALYYFKYVQCAFEGTRRMLAGMREAELPDPIFVQRTTGQFQVVVTLKNDHEHRKMFVRAEAATAINPDLYATLSESEKMIVNYLADRERINVTDTGILIGLDWRATKLVLDGLEKKKVIERSSGKPRSRHRFYFLKRPIS